MCTNRKYITNPYTGRRILVSCGSCPACLQAKANRLTNRLEQNTSIGDLCLFVTLSYMDDFVPYIYKSDLKNYECKLDLPVYRRKKIRFYGDNTIISDGPFVIGYLNSVLSSSGKDEKTYLSFIPNLRKHNGSFSKKRMGVSFFKDFQDFKKRLRVNLSRSLGGKEFSLSFFGCGEFGETHRRPHFHTLIYTELQYYEVVRSAIIKSWPFHDWNINPQRKIQIARDAAAYVASYVNQPADFPQMLQTYIRPKRSFSPNIGLSNPYFSLNSLLAKADYSALFYPRRIFSGGVESTIDIPIPQYVISRYFPKFKGYNRCDFNSLVCFLQQPNRITFTAIERECSPLIDNNVVRTNLFFDNGVLSSIGSYIDSSIHNIITSVSNARDKYLSLTNKTGYDYAIDFVRVWSAYSRTLLRLNYESELPLSELYDNWLDVSLGNVSADSMPIDAILDYNSIPHIVHQSFNLSDLYRKKIKQKKTTDFIFTKFLNYENR